MSGRRHSRRAPSLFQFDKTFLLQYGCIAGVDEAGRGPLAGPVVAAAVILPPSVRIIGLNDSKQLSALQREAFYKRIQQAALAIGVGIIEADEIDRVNIRQASFSAMRVALERLVIYPRHVLVDGFRVPYGPKSQTGIVDGDAKSAHIAAASVIAKVTRDVLMEAWDARFPAYGFKKHKGYGTREHFLAIERFGPCPIHRRSFSPVRLQLETSAHLIRE